MILLNGRVLTVDPAFSIRSTVVIKEGKNLAVGGPELARRYTAPNRTDLQGMTLLPSSGLAPAMTITADLESRFKMIYRLGASP